MIIPQVYLAESEASDAETTRTEPAETSVYSRTIIPDDVRNARTSRAEFSLEMRRML